MGPQDLFFNYTSSDCCQCLGDWGGLCFLSGFLWGVWHSLMFYTFSHSRVCSKYNVTVHKELEQSSVCVKTLKERAEGEVRAQACWELCQLPSIIRVIELSLRQHHLRWIPPPPPALDSGPGSGRPES